MTPTFTATRPPVFAAFPEQDLWAEAIANKMDSQSTILSIGAKIVNPAIALLI
jgi:hypothetical protein